nr:EAL domain-containing protein [Natronocella acetinitrilica]
MNQATIAYQPIVSVCGPLHRVCAHEALFRLPGVAEGGIEGLIAGIEASGEAGALDAQVLNLVLARQALDARASGRHRHLSINVSPQSICSLDYLRLVERALLTHPHPESIQFEVTERQALCAPAIAETFSELLAAFGASIAIDDFAATPAQVQMIERLSGVGRIKIDRGVVRAAIDSVADYNLIREAIELAAECGASVVAEGVEDPEQLYFLRTAFPEITHAQGYLFGRPAESFSDDVDMRARLRELLPARHRERLAVTASVAGLRA